MVHWSSRINAKGKNRPNKLGVTVELLEISNKKMIVKGLDAIDGTPIIEKEG